MTRKRAGALIIKDKSLLLMREGDAPSFWTPGGKLEPGETYVQALERELDEELGAKLHQADYFMSIQDKAADERIRYFLASVTFGQSLPDSVETYMYSPSNQESQHVAISERLQTLVIPRLVSVGLIQ